MGFRVLQTSIPVGSILPNKSVAPMRDPLKGVLCFLYGRTGDKSPGPSTLRTLRVQVHNLDRLSLDLILILPSKIASSYNTWTLGLGTLSTNLLVYIMPEGFRY